MTPDTDAARPAAQGSHAGQWGLAALLLAIVPLLLFPLMVFLLIFLLRMAWETPELERQHLDYGILGGRAVIYGLGGLSALGLLFGLVGLLQGMFRSQPIGLPLADIAAALVSWAASGGVALTGEYVVEDLNRMRNTRPRLRAADAEKREVKAAVERDPHLEPDLDLAMPDGVLVEGKADAILVKAGRGEQALE